MHANSKKFKVKTGCITCKIRKVKCDEGKPDCMRCASTGRKCDGYARSNGEDIVTERKLLLDPSTPKLAKSITLYANITALPGINSAEDARWLEYFRTYAGPSMSDLADKDFWTHVLPQLSVSEPAIRHALLAVGSSYARFEAHVKSNSALRKIEDSHSIKNYNLAIANLRQTHLQAQPDVTVPLVCCLLFICLECLHANEPLMLNHLNNGLKILSSAQSKTANFGCVQSIGHKLEQIFRRLDAQSALSGKPVFLSTGDPSLAFDLDLPNSFGDIAQAKMFLDNINSMNLNFIRLINDGAFSEKYQNYSPVLFQRRLQEQFIAWKRVFDNSGDMTSSTHVNRKHAITRLHIVYYASFIYLSNCLEVEETVYDNYKTHFATMVSLARSVLLGSEESASSSLISYHDMWSTDTSSIYSTGFSLEASLIPSLYLTAIKCRDPTIRRDAISLLAINNGREGLWYARIHWRVARRIVEIEEGNMLKYQGAAEAFMDEAPSMRMQASNGAVLTDAPLERCRVLGADIIRSFEMVPRFPAQITFYMKPYGLLEPEIRWTEPLLY